MVFRFFYFFIRVQIKQIKDKKKIKGGIEERKRKERRKGRKDEERWDNKKEVKNVKL